MRLNTSAVAVAATKPTRTSVHLDEQSFGSVLTDIAKLLWPYKTAAHLAAVAGCTERAAEFYLAGDRDWSGDALNAVVSEVLKRHKMRNAKVVSR